MQSTPLLDPRTQLMVHKAVFVVFYKSRTIGLKIRKICDAFGARTYPVPDLGHPGAVEELRANNALEIHESSLVLAKNVEQREALARFLARNVSEWTWTVVRERGIYHSLNMFKADVAGMLRAEGWVVEAK